MDGATNPALIGAIVAMATALGAAFSFMWVATRSRRDATMQRDRAASILLGAAGLLMICHLFAICFVAVGGMTYIGLLKAAMLLTAAFAIVGAGIGLMRGLRRGKALKPRRAPRDHFPT